MKRKSIRIFFWITLILVLVPVLLGLGIFGLVYSGAFGPLPSQSQLADIQNATASVILDSHGRSIGRIFDENRTNAAFEEFPQSLVSALIATEDARFFEHQGVDLRSIMRVLVKSILLGDASAGGGSTLSQQLSKNLYGRSDHGFLSLPVSKFKEMIIASRLEDTYSKEVLIELYFNTVPFGENVFGIETAALRYFHKEVSALSVSESAVLVGMLKANTYYNPRLHPENAQKRRDVVLAQMQRYGYLSQESRDSLIDLPLIINYFNPGQHRQTAYYLAQVNTEVRNILSRLPDPSLYSPETDGLRITTTLDASLQAIAEKALADHLAMLQALFDRHWQGKSPWDSDGELAFKELKKSRFWQQGQKNNVSKAELIKKAKVVSPAMVYDATGDKMAELSPLDSVAYYLGLLRAGLVAIDPTNGAVRAWVGGLDYQFMPFDHVLAYRQPASTFKPIVYAAHLETGNGPCSYWENERRVYSAYENWTPENYDKEYGGYYSTAGALKKSVNVAAVQALLETGIEEVISLATMLGFSNPPPAHPSIALGTSSVSLLELTQAYASFANGGFGVKAFVVQAIHDKNGNLIYQYEPEEPIRVISNETAQMMTAMLQKVVDEGTARSMRTKYYIKEQLAGKTGTAQNYADTWFVAYTPALVMATWVGGIYPSIHFRTGDLGSSSKQAVPIIAKMLEGMLDTTSLSHYFGEFPNLSEETKAALDCDDFRERTIFDGLKEVIDPKEGKKVKTPDQKEPGFLKRLFGGKKKS